MLDDLKIYPSVLTDSVETAQIQVALTAGSQYVNTTQIDIIDGVFADMLTISITGYQDIDFMGTTTDLHLMVEEPLDFVYEAQDTHLPIHSIIAQVEKMSNQVEFVKQVKSNDWKVGLSLDLYTPLDAVDDEVWSEIDSLQVMTNVAGRQGQELHPHALETLKEVVTEVTQHNLDLEVIVDIGVKLDTIAELYKIGARGFSIGSGLWKEEDFDSAVVAFHEAVEQSQNK
jgi:ribulose-phosphate 3-epimerase